MKLYAETIVKRTEGGYTVTVNGCEFAVPFDGEMRVGFELNWHTFVPVNLPVMDARYPRMLVAFIVSNAELKALAESGAMVRYVGPMSGMTVSEN